MTIGIDAGALSITDERLRVGVWRVTYNLLKEFANIDTKNEYRLYTFVPIDREVMRAFGRNMKNVVVRPAIGWSMIQLPIELRRHPVDVFLGLSQMIPYGASRNIGFLYDVGFLHFPDAYPGSLRRLEHQTKQLVSRSDRIVCISRVTQADVLRRYHFPADRIVVAYPGVDARFTAHGVRHTEEHPYILFVGALKRGKNVPLALRIFRKFLDSAAKPYNFVIVGGDYWADPEISKTIKALNLETHIKRAGFVADGELPALYRGSEALLVTSMWEGFCLPAVEAMRSGCPVVYRNAGSLSEIVGSAGSIFETEREAVDALLRKKHAAAGLRRSAAFTWSGFAASVYSIMSSK